jgi:hypothetical protein
LRLLQPHDPDNYYVSRELIPIDFLDDLKKAKIVITNFHAFKLRERVELSAGGRALLQGRGEELNTLETEGQMLQRVMPDLMGIKNILVRKNVCTPMRGAISFPPLGQPLGARRRGGSNEIRYRRVTLRLQRKKGLVVNHKRVLRVIARGPEGGG